MDLKLYSWLVIFIVGCSVWYYSSLHLGIKYDRHLRTLNPLTGDKLDPRDVIKYSKVVYLPKDYINSTNAEERLHDMIYFTNIANAFLHDQHYTNPEDLKVSGLPASDQAKCGRQLEWILNQLNLNKNYTFIKGPHGLHLTNYMDSFGRTEAGYYSGVSRWNGNYRQCMKVSLDGGKIRGRYCTGRMRPKWWPQNETIYPPTVMRIGMCLPETCDTQSLDYYKSSIEQLAKYQLTKFYQDGYDMVSMFCLPDERSPLRQIPTSGWIFLTVMGVWFSLVIIATIIYENCYRQKKSLEIAYKKVLAANSAEDNNLQLAASKHLIIGSNNSNSNCRSIAPEPPSTLQKLCEALSLRCAVKSFKTRTFNVDYAGGQRTRVNLNPLDCFKAYMAIYVVMGHSGFLNQSFRQSIAQGLETSTYVIRQYGMAIVLFVDTFFLIFGLLTTYTLMRKFKPDQLVRPVIWLSINVRVFLRITPIYMMIFWFSHSVAPYLDEGPVWDYGVDKTSLRGNCLQEPWWISIPIMIATRRLQYSVCVPTSWFIVSYLQLAFVLPLVTYILCKLPNHLCRMLFVGFTGLVSVMHITMHMANFEAMPAELFARIGTLISDLVDKFEETGYMTTIGRFYTVCVGCYAGLLLRQYEEGIIDKWPKWLEKKTTIFLAVFSILLTINLPLVIGFDQDDTKVAFTFENMMFGNIGRITVWPIINVILIIGVCSTYNHTAISRFFGHKFWYSYSKLCLIIYLIHFEILYNLTTSYEHGPVWGLLREDYRYWTIAFFWSTIIGAFIYLTIETPLIKLIALLDNYLTKPRLTPQRNIQNQECEMNKVSTVQIE